MIPSIQSRALGLAFALSAMFAIAPASATVLASNLSNAAGGVEIATGNDALCAAFRTDSAPHTLYSVTLTLARVSTGSARVSIYSSRNLEPGSLLATLTSPATYANVPTPTAFT
jgi:hypothetical protein